MTAYHDLDPMHSMRADAAEVGQRLLPSARGLHYDDAYTDLYAEFPTDAPKARVEITQAAQRLANALHLHLD